MLKTNCMIVKRLSILLIAVIFLSFRLYPQSGIDGQLLIDTTIWNPVIYLSIISDFNDLNSMSNDMIIEKSKIDDFGRFKINTQFLPNNDCFYRLHVSKRNYPPASLIIGGKDENYIFIVANRKTNIHIIDTNRQELFKGVRINGYFPNKLLHQVDEIASYLDSSSFNGSTVKIELIRSAIFEKLRSFADTCTNPLISLYALYRSKFDKNYPVNQTFYKNFLVKWKKEQSFYFAEFRKKIPDSKKNTLILIILLLMSFVAGFLISRKLTKTLKKSQNAIFKLSQQERRIFALILQGKSNKEISEILNIELSTVKSHIVKSGDIEHPCPI
jgi:hypothetical protein